MLGSLGIQTIDVGRIHESSIPSKANRVRTSTVIKAVFLVALVATFSGGPVLAVVGNVLLTTFAYLLPSTLGLHLTATSGLFI
jgi:hypothetical protein